MAAAVKGAGLVFVNNPNNPTATVHGAPAIADFVERVRAESPDTVILIDEAYHDYVTDPAYRTAVPLAMETPNVFVARTFSKAYGMAGLRIGYADRAAPTRSSSWGWDAVQRQRRWVAAAWRALGDPKHIEAERAAQHRGARVHRQGVRRARLPASDSQTNFLFVDIGRPAQPSSATPARSRGSSSAATFRRSRRRTRASPSARWTR